MGANGISFGVKVSDQLVGDQPRCDMVDSHSPPTPSDKRSCHMSNEIAKQIRALKDLPRWEVGNQGDEIKKQIEKLRKAEVLNEAAAAQLEADVNNESARILRSPVSVMTHERDEETGRVLSSRIDHPDGSAQTRVRDADGNLTDWVDVPTSK